MDNIKISVRFSINGTVKYSEKDASGDPVHYKKNTIDLYDKKKKRTETFTYKTSKYKPITQNINMTQEAYQYMLSTPVEGTSANHWKRMSVKQRIAEHLKEVQANLGANSFEFTIFED